MRLRTVWLGGLLAVGICVGAGAQDENPVYDSPEAAAADPDFAVQGEYASDTLGVQVVALGNDAFRVVIHRGGLPGAGWDRSERQVSEESAAGVKELIKDFELKKVERASPTLGAEPPDGAVVLFDGTEETFKQHWQDGARISDDGLLIQGATSTDTFQDFTIHIEFRLPYMPKARGQARGNSGIYYQGRYETQMLDSFGLDGKNNETGGIYEIRDPDLNMCLPPLVWQTYDADFTAARFNAQGEKVANARLTVRLNGVEVQPNVEVPRPTRAAPLGESAEPGPIYLQDHGNPVRYRNIWVLPRDAEQEARRPIIPAFERFHNAAATGSQPFDAGSLLLGELNCTACHAATEELARDLIPRTAPRLTDVGRRVQPGWIARFIADPHVVKPGTTMPDVLSKLSDDQRDEAARSIASFLASTGRVPEQRPDRQLAREGETLFHTVGCAACHAPRETTDSRQPGSSQQPGFSLATSVPLGALEQKYSIPSLIEFLKDPHAVRPGGRMPSLNLKDEETQRIAHYLLGELVLAPRNPNMRYAVYHGSWDRVPNFDELEPVRTGEGPAFDLTVAERRNDFGVRFDGFLRIDEPGEYTFHLGSDDGSLLYINGEKVVDTDGIHPHTVHSGRVRLEQGMHPIRVEYQQAGGEWTLALEYEGPGVARQDAFAMIGLTPDPAGVPAAQTTVDPADSAAFVVDESLVERGRELFASIGCASCHEMSPDGQRIASSLAAKPLSELNLAEGCLSAERNQVSPRNLVSAAPIPNFDLTRPQIAALTTSLSTPANPEASNERRIAQTMAAFNCYACHARGEIGGPERERNDLFVTTIPEMGDEGRIPPPLDGAGDKLNDAWLGHILRNGANDRPYMLTRMPRFGTQPVEQLAAAFIAEDRVVAGSFPTPDDPEHRVKAEGRRLVGDQALGCIKCHTFGPHRATGIQAMDLQKMTQRLRADWFHRYLPNPQAYRPGTRMPSGFPDGVATVKDIYDGDMDRQVSAIWTYLTDGSRAGVPDGLVAQLIELKPESEPIIYRNFLEGLSSRAIAVGYPEECNLAWDADRMGLALIWHGRFIDASMHWEGRGQGAQRPLGDHIMTWEENCPVAVLESAEAPWPAEMPKDRGYRFRGYSLDEQKRPSFRYETSELSITDDFEPVASAEGDATFRRRVTIAADGNVPNVYFRAASGETIEPQTDGWYLVSGAVRVQVTGGNPPILRQNNGRSELLVPVDLTSGSAEIVEEITW